MVIFPLSAREETTIRWAVRIVPPMAIALILFLGAIALATLQV